MKIRALASEFPCTLVTNDDLAKSYPEWDFPRLKARTGVSARYIAEDGETALDLAIRAATKLIVDGCLSPDTIDAVLFCTETPDYLIPGNAAMAQHLLGLREATFCLDINMGCSAFPYLLQIAEGLQQGGVAERVLIFTADTYSRYIHPDDRATRVLFGDGAVATLLSHDPDAPRYQALFGARGEFHDRFFVRDGGARHPAATSHDNAGERDNFIRMNGMKVLSFFNMQIPKVVSEVLHKNSLTLENIDGFVFHQASAAALDSIQRAIGISDDRMIRAFDGVGNLVSASIPAALDTSMRNGSLKRGDLVLLCGFGVGLSWSAKVIRL